MRPRTKIYNKVAGESRSKKLRTLYLSLLLLSVTLTISLWMIIEIMDESSMFSGFPWDGVRMGNVPELLALFLLCFSATSLYIVNYKGIKETSKTTPRYLAAIMLIVILARLLFRF